MPTNRRSTTNKRSNIRSKKKGITPAPFTGNTSGTINWDEVDRVSADSEFNWNIWSPEELYKFISMVTLQGDMVSFSITRDGGVLAIKVYHDGARKDIWIRHRSEVGDLMIFITGHEADYPNQLPEYES